VEIGTMEGQESATWGRSDANKGVANILAHGAFGCPVLPHAKNDPLWCQFWCHTSPIVGRHRVT
jgi:hypothetical protein